MVYYFCFRGNCVEKRNHKSIDFNLADASLRKKLPKKSSSIIVIEFRPLEVYEKDKILNLPIGQNHQFF